MTSKTNEAIKATPGLASDIERADKILASVIGPSTEVIKSYLGEGVTADWNEGRDDQNRRVAKLILSNSSNSVSATFGQKELKNPDRLEKRFNRLWGDLLQEISHKLSSKLRQTVAALEEN